MIFKLKSIGEIFNVHHDTVLHGLKHFDYYIDRKSYECFKMIAENHLSGNKNTNTIFRK